MNTTIAIDTQTEEGIVTLFYYAIHDPEQFKITEGFGVATNFSWPTHKKAKEFLNANWVELAKLIPYGTKTVGHFYLVTKRGDTK